MLGMRLSFFAYSLYNEHFVQDLQVAIVTRDFADLRRRYKKTTKLASTTGYTKNNMT